MPLEVEPTTGDAFSPVVVLLQEFAAMGGTYCGDAATLVDLPVDQPDLSVLEVGDWSRLTATDGANASGVYVWNGSAWVWSSALTPRPRVRAGGVWLRGIDEPVPDGAGGSFLTADGLIQVFSGADLYEVGLAEDAGEPYWALRTVPLRANSDSGASAESLEPEGSHYEIKVLFVTPTGQEELLRWLVNIDADVDYDSVLVDGAIPAASISIAGVPGAVQDLFDARIAGSATVGDLDDRVTALEQVIPGAAGDKPEEFLLEAAGALAVLRVVKMTLAGVAYWEPTDDPALILGMTKTSTSGAGQDVRVAPDGVIVASGAGLLAGTVYWAGPAGVLSATPPVTGNQVIAGHAPDVDFFSIRIRRPSLQSLVWSGSAWLAVTGARAFVQLAGDPDPTGLNVGDLVFAQS